MTDSDREFFKKCSRQLTVIQSRNPRELASDPKARQVAFLLCEEASSFEQVLKVWNVAVDGQQEAMVLEKALRYAEWPSQREVIRRMVSEEWAQEHGLVHL